MKYKIFITAVIVFGIFTNTTFAASTSVTATNAGRLESSDATYTTARDATTATGVATTFVSVGQNLNFSVWRSFFSFAIPDGGIISAASLFLEGRSDISSVNFDVYVLGSSYSSPLIDADFDLIDGHQASGAYNGTVLNNTWNSASYSATWNEFVFNAAGLLAVSAAKNSTLKLAIISKEDYDSSEPVDNEYIYFESSATAGKEPYLLITYTVPSVPSDDGLIIFE